MPVRTSRYPVNSKAIGILDQERYNAAELTQEGELAILDETKDTLKARIARLDSGMAWAEDPPSRTRHMITNIEVEAGETASELKVYANYLVYRSRGETEQDFYVGRREVFCGTSTASGRSPAVRLSWTRASCWPRTSAFSSREQMNC